MDIAEVIASLTPGFRLFFDRRNGLSEATVVELETEFGMCFEAGYRRFLRSYGCGAAVAHPSDIRQEYGFEVYGGRAVGDIPAGLDVRLRFAEARRRGRPGLPLLGLLGRHVQLVAIDGHLAWWGTRGGCGGRTECGFPEPVDEVFDVVVARLAEQLGREQEERRVVGELSSAVCAVALGR